MTLGLIGMKVGMSRLFTPEGKMVPVTVLHVPVNQVVQLKTLERDGYSAVQLAMGECKPSRISRPCAGHLKAAGIAPSRVLREFRVNEETFDAGQRRFGVSLFSEGLKVHVVGTSKGKGFAGVVKRHNFSTQDMSHGNSISHRAPGSIGQCQDPGKVFKGKKMAGHMGDVRVTVKNLWIAKIDTERNLLLLRGAVPGSKGGVVTITPASSTGTEVNGS